MSGLSLVPFPHCASSWLAFSLPPPPSLSHPGWHRCQEAFFVSLMGSATNCPPFSSTTDIFQGAPTLAFEPSSLSSPVFAYPIRLCLPSRPVRRPSQSCPCINIPLRCRIQFRRLALSHYATKFSALGIIVPDDPRTELPLMVRCTSRRVSTPCDTLNSVITAV